MKNICVFFEKKLPGLERHKNLKSQTKSLNKILYIIYNINITYYNFITYTNISYLNGFKHPKF